MEETSWFKAIGLVIAWLITMLLSFVVIFLPVLGLSYLFGANVLIPYLIFLVIVGLVVMVIITKKKGSL